MLCFTSWSDSQPFATWENMKKSSSPWNSHLVQLGEKIPDSLGEGQKKAGEEGYSGVTFNQEELDNTLQVRQDF